MSATCVFCQIVAEQVPAHLVHRDDGVIAFLDRSPLVPGHVLVAPRAHVPTLDDLPADQMAPVFELVRRVSVAIQGALGADGSFVAVNTRVSQSVAHLHVHVVPRRQKDGFFSPRMLWKRQAYASDDHAAKTAAMLRSALG